MEFFIKLLYVVAPAVIAVFLAELQKRKNYQQNLFNTKYAPYLQKKIFKKNIFTIEHNLFKKITPDNKNIILANISKLYNEVQEDKALFICIDNLLLDSLHNLTKSHHKKIQTIQKNYNRFSKHYLINLNETRKALGLKPRNDIYLKTYNLYQEKHYHWYSFKKDFKQMLGFVIFGTTLALLVTFFIVSLINLIYSTEQLISGLTNKQ